MGGPESYPCNGHLPLGLGADPSPGLPHNDSHSAAHTGEEGAGFPGELIAGLVDLHLRPKGSR